MYKETTYSLFVLYCCKQVTSFLFSLSLSLFFSLHLSLSLSFPFTSLFILYYVILVYNYVFELVELYYVLYFVVYFVLYSVLYFVLYIVFLVFLCGEPNTSLCFLGASPPLFWIGNKCLFELNWIIIICDVYIAHNN